MHSLDVYVNWRNVVGIRCISYRIKAFFLFSVTRYVYTGGHHLTKQHGGYIRCRICCTATLISHKVWAMWCAEKTADCCSVQHNGWGGRRCDKRFSRQGDPLRDRFVNMSSMKDIRLRRWWNGHDRWVRQLTFWTTNAIDYSHLIIKATRLDHERIHSVHKTTRFT